MFLLRIPSVALRGFYRSSTTVLCGFRKILTRHEVFEPGSGPFVRFLYGLYRGDIEGFRV